jgi:N-dimethylarginine dimethylaminohydrolase
MKLLMCRPYHFDIEYQINPWMNVKRRVDPDRAADQWDSLHRIFTENLSVDVELVDPVAGLPDMVFTANAGFVRGNIFVLSNFRYVERRNEACFFEDWFRKNGYFVVHLPKSVFFEGAGDVIPAGNKLFAGYRFRSDIRSHTALSQLLNLEVVSLELVDPRFYHLDTCFCVLPGGELIYYPKAFDRYANRLIEEHFEVGKRLRVAKPEADRFACNAVPVGKTVVSNSGCDRMARGLERWGYRSVQTDLSEFLKSGGTARCLTLWI